jgi:hypothetical protein
VPLDVTAEYGTRVLYTAGEVEGLEEHPSSSEFNNVDLLNENERIESDGVSDIGEEFFGQFSPDFDADDDADADYEVRSWSSFHIRGVHGSASSNGCIRTCEHY